MKNKNAFTLVELLVSLIIAAIVVLTIGVLSSISNSSFNKINNKQQVYNDISYGLKLMQSKVRASSTLSITVASGSWVSQRVSVSTGNFGIYRNTTYNPARREFSFDNGTAREIILSVDDPNNSSAALDLTATQNTNAVTVTISGLKNNIPFNVQTTATRRNP